jgi:hypothetical protein
MVLYQGAVWCCGSMTGALRLDKLLTKVVRSGGNDEMDQAQSTTPGPRAVSEVHVVHPSG